jgi:ABC-type multidrug transport system ATPase subunit
VLKAASFWAREGQISALMGRNGSGKTTLLNIAVGEVKMDTGVVRFRSQAYERPRLPVLARGGLYYLEARGHLPGTFPVGAQLNMIAERFGGQAFDRVVAELEIEQYLEKRSHELSGGEGRRAALAAAMIRQPLCLLADEPFAGLAPKDQEMIGRALRRLAEAGTAIVTTGHDVAALLAVADDVIWCVAGTTHGLGRPQDARAHPEFERDYLGWHLEG